MTFLSTNISGARLSINGVDYSDEFVDFTVTDDSIVSSSLVTTNGDITLAQVRGGQHINDLTATRFAAGDIVLLDIKQPDGTFNRHLGVIYLFWLLSVILKPELVQLVLVVKSLLL